MYLELDGTFLRYHQGAEKKEPILVATGYRIDGTRVLLHIGVGNGESYANWKGFLQEMVARGLREPLLIVTDGNPGVLKAIEEVFPQSLKQRCQKHRLENILGKAPKEIHDELKAEILESFHAKSYEQGLKKGREVITRYRQRFPRGPSHRPRMKGAAPSVGVTPTSLANKVCEEVGQGPLVCRGHVRPGAVVGRGQLYKRDGESRGSSDSDLSRRHALEKPQTKCGPRTSFSP